MRLMTARAASHAVEESIAQFKGVHALCRRQPEQVIDAADNGRNGVAVLLREPLMLGRCRVARLGEPANERLQMRFARQARTNERVAAPKLVAHHTDAGRVRL